MKNITVNYDEQDLEMLTVALDKAVMYNVNDLQKMGKYFSEERVKIRKGQIADFNALRAELRELIDDIKEVLELSSLAFSRDELRIIGIALRKAKRYNEKELKGQRSRYFSANRRQMRLSQISRFDELARKADV